MLQTAYENNAEQILQPEDNKENKAKPQSKEQKLLASISSGDQKAMEVFYHRYGDRVFQFALKTLKNTEDAAEVLNEVMLEVWKKPESFQGRSMISTWLLSITHHKSVDLVRKKSRHDKNDSYDLDTLEAQQKNALTAMTSEQHENYVRQTINNLPAIYREVIYLAFYQELSYPEIAEILSIPVGTVKTRIMNAKKQLKKAITQ